jgi:hypothetical protein
MSFSIKSGATAPALVVTLYDDTTPLDLTGATVRMRMRRREGGALVVDSPATVLTPTEGLVSYQWLPADTDEVGDFEVEFEVTFAGGAEQVFPADGYVMVNIEPSLTAEVAVLPDMPDSCWPVDHGCCDDFDTYPLSVQERADALASQTMRMLTGYSVGGCPVLLRPCTSTCASTSVGWYYNGGTFYPHIDALGRWVNACGCSYNCACSALSVIELGGIVGRVVQVKQDGVVVPTSAYRVDNGNRLVRLDGEVWPACQDMAAPDTAVGTLSVSVQRGALVDGLGAYAAGLLACEYAKACSGKKCRLPSGVTNVTRQGVTMEIASTAFPGGLTGIREVDIVIKRYNPHGLTRPSAVWSPDISTPVTHA